MPARERADLFVGSPSLSMLPQALNLNYSRGVIDLDPGPPHAGLFVPVPSISSQIPLAAHRARRRSGDMLLRGRGNT